MKLANENGRAWRTDELKGKFALLYFGFTMCPDICPDELEKMAECVDLVEKAGKSIVPVFVSIDPERDSVRRVKEYVKEFHPKLLGVTGSVEAQGGREAVQGVLSQDGRRGRGRLPRGPLHHHVPRGPGG